MLFFRIPLAINPLRFFLVIPILLSACLGFAQPNNKGEPVQPFHRQAQFAWVKIYPFHLFTFQYRLGFEKIISSRYSAIFEITRITKGPYGSSDQPILGTCKKFLPTSGVKLQGGLRYYLSEEKSNFHWFAEATFLYQSLAYKAFSFVPANQCAKFYPYYKRIAPQQKDLGFAVYLGQQIAVHGNIRVESYLGLSVRNRHENQGQTSPGEDPPHYHSPGWFQDFQKIKPPFSEQKIGFHFGFSLLFGG